jgi:predicted ATPase with chaperone activity
MPFKSKAQRRKFAQLLVEGKISNETYEEWNRETGAKTLRDRVATTRQRERGRKRNAAQERCKGEAHEETIEIACGHPYS